MIEKRNNTKELSRLNLILPLASFGHLNELRKQLQGQDEQFKRMVSKLIAQDLLIGLWQMHKLNYYHMDVKLGNVVVTAQGRGLIIDFGCTEKIEKKKVLLLNQ